MIRESHRYPRAAVEFAWARDWKRDGLRDSLYAWRWPVGLLTALVLWLALVTLVGAATLAPHPRGDDGCTPSASGGSPQAQQVLRTGLNRL
jgi:hypothetical protein